mmetsp:Transcript_24671/g.75209  ORF Transcript_24671/g.75209 Transcript_24671/m.75209 type:complete len:236 (-) Transcript_24671:1284-1991(-)
MEAGSRGERGTALCASAGPIGGVGIGEGAAELPVDGAVAASASASPAPSSKAACCIAKRRRIAACLSFAWRFRRRISALWGEGPPVRSEEVAPRNSGSSSSTCWRDCAEAAHTSRMQCSALERRAPNRSSLTRRHNRSSMGTIGPGRAEARIPPTGGGSGTGACSMLVTIQSALGIRRLVASDTRPVSLTPPAASARLADGSLRQLSARARRRRAAMSMRSDTSGEPAVAASTVA